VEKLEKHQNLHTRATREIAFLSLLGASMAFLPTLIPVAAVAFAGVVMIGIAGYITAVNRIEQLEDENLRLDSVILDLGKNQEKIQEKLNALDKNVNTLIEQHNKLARDFEGFYLDITKMITFSTEIGNQLTTVGQLLEESLHSWRHGKVSEKLFKALQLGEPCNGTCPYELLTAMSWSMNKELLEIGILGLKIDQDREIIEADPFVLYDQDNCKYIYSGESKIAIEKGKRVCYLRRTHTIKEGLTAAGEELKNCSAKKENPWNKKGCEHENPEPQVKRLELNNIIYCKGLKIKIDSFPEKDCPNNAFSLALTQNFSIGNYTYTASTIDLKPHVFKISISQQVNAHLMHTYNPYTMEPTELDALHLTKIGKVIHRKVQGNFGTILCAGVGMSLLLAAG
jgi:hypothetical protein